VLKLIALIVPLSLDTFVVTPAVGASGLHPGRRLRVAMLFTAGRNRQPKLDATPDRQLAKRGIKELLGAAE